MGKTTEETYAWFMDICSVICTCEHVVEHLPQAHDSTERPISPDKAAKHVRVSIRARQRKPAYEVGESHNGVEHLDTSLCQYEQRHRNLPDLQEKENLTYSQELLAVGRRQFASAIVHLSVRFAHFFSSCL